MKSYAFAPNALDPNDRAAATAARVYAEQSNSYEPHNIPQPAGELTAIRSRIDRHTMELLEVAAQLRNHADDVHGPRQEMADGSRGVSDKRIGQLGAIYDSLDQLSIAITALAEQAGRNCTLA